MSMRHTHQGNCRKHRFDAVHACLRSVWAAGTPPCKQRKSERTLRNCLYCHQQVTKQAQSIREKASSSQTRGSDLTYRGFARYAYLRTSLRPRSAIRRTSWQPGPRTGPHRRGLLFCRLTITLLPRQYRTMTLPNNFFSCSATRSI